MRRWLRKLHRWVGLLIGLQFVLWMASGLLMALLDHDVVMGHATRTHSSAPVWPVAQVLPPAQVARSQGTGLSMVESAWLGAAPMYNVTRRNDSWLVDARTGMRRPVGAADVLASAMADYAGEGKAASPVLLTGPDMEARKHEGPLWRVSFDDAENTTLYLSERDARVLERRNDTWRLFDIAWMLHIMDYTERKDFNHPLVIMAAAGGLWMALTGVWLLFAVFRLRDFVPARWLPVKLLTVESDSMAPRSLKGRDGASVFDTLAGNGMDLPSTCGGGQQCGLCQVQVRGAAPEPTDAERSLISAARLAQGFRLACSLRLDQPLHVRAAFMDMQQVSATVIAVNAVAPLLREIRLKLPATFTFVPGDSVQVQAPAHALELAELDIPAQHAAAYASLAPLRSYEAPAWRCYSPSLPCDGSGEITLLVRFLAGQGSGYLYSVKTGDTVAVRGPCGLFRLSGSAAPKVLVGGGAGIAPLRAMLYLLVGSGATEPIAMWYGARELAEAPYAGDFEAMADMHANVSAALVLSGEGTGGGALHGLVHEALRAALEGRSDLRDCEFYVCGPPAMLAATLAMLANLGVAADKIAFEDFRV